VIARTWRGATRAADAALYVDYLADTGLRAYAATPGNRGVLTLRRTVPHPDGERAEFLLVSLWDSMEAVRGFAGPDPERAVFYPEDERFLVEADPGVRHYEIVDVRGLVGAAD
jgi:heme-degrading monooxygenase HmoA